MAILPAGAATEADGLSLSGPALAGLLKGFKSEFDVILIDTGPALGRIEACVVARQVDGILPVICRGQKQSLWNETLDELESVGTLSGAVFNRANPKDFDRSIRRRPGYDRKERLRSIPGSLTNLGPLVRAMALSLPQDIELFPISGKTKPDVRKVA